MIKFFDTADRGILDCASTELDLPTWFGMDGLLCLRFLEREFKTTAGIGVPWTQDGSISFEVWLIQHIYPDGACWFVKLDVRHLRCLGCWMVQNAKIPIDPQDCHLLGCRVHEGGDMCINTGGTSGVAYASSYWSRLASAVGRFFPVPRSTHFDDWAHACC